MQPICHNVQPRRQGPTLSMARGAPEEGWRVNSAVLWAKVHREEAWSSREGPGIVWACQKLQCREQVQTPGEGQQPVKLPGRERAPEPLKQTPRAGGARTVIVNIDAARSVGCVRNAFPVLAHSIFQTTLWSGVCCSTVFQMRKPRQEAI